MNTGRFGKLGGPLVATFVICWVFACGGVTDIEPHETRLSFALDLSEVATADVNVTRVHVLVENSFYSTEQDLEITSELAWGTFDGLPAGTYEITVTLYDGDTAIASGGGWATIIPGEVTRATINIATGEGTLIVAVVWDSPYEIRLIEPNEGAVLDNGCRSQTDSIIWDFDWTDVQGAQRYHLYVIGDSAIYPVIDIDYLTTSFYHSADIAYIIERNRYDWAWKVRAMVGGRWGEWSETRLFDVEPLNTDCGG